MSVVVWDVVRAVTAIFSLMAVGLCIASWFRSLSPWQVARFVVLAGYAAATGVTDYLRMGIIPIEPWRLIADLVLTVSAAIVSGMFYLEPLLVKPPTHQDVQAIQDRRQVD